MDRELLFKIRMMAREKAMEANDPTVFKDTYMALKETLREGSKKEIDDIKDYQFKDERLKKQHGVFVQSFHKRDKHNGN